MLRPGSQASPTQSWTAELGARVAVTMRRARLLSSQRRSELLRALVAAATAAAAAVAAARGHLKVGARKLNSVLIGLQLFCARTCS